jgi:hypothetical protein
MLMPNLSLIGLVDFADLSLDVVMLHLSAFDPDRIPPRRA